MFINFDSLFYSRKNKMSASNYGSMNLKQLKAAMDDRFPNVKKSNYTKKSDIVALLEGRVEPVFKNSAAGRPSATRSENVVAPVTIKSIDISNIPEKQDRFAALNLAIRDMNVGQVDQIVAATVTVNSVPAGKVDVHLQEVTSTFQLRGSLYETFNSNDVNLSKDQQYTFIIALSTAPLVNGVYQLSFKTTFNVNGKEVVITIPFSEIVASANAARRDDGRKEIEPQKPDNQTFITLLQDEVKKLPENQVSITSSQDVKNGSYNQSNPIQISVQNSSQNQPFVPPRLTSSSLTSNQAPMLGDANFQAMIGSLDAFKQLLIDYHKNITPDTYKKLVESSNNLRAIHEWLQTGLKPL